MKRPIAISDSANFYVSAERIFDPSLKGVPVDAASAVIAAPSSPDGSTEAA